MALPDDASSIAAILYESFVEYMSSYTPEAFNATTSGVDQIQVRMKEGPIWVALQDEPCCGALPFSVGPFGCMNTMVLEIAVKGPHDLFGTPLVTMEKLVEPSAQERDV